MPDITGLNKSFKLNRLGKFTLNRNIIGATVALSNSTTLSPKGHVVVVGKRVLLSGNLTVTPSANNILRAFDSVVNVAEVNKKINVIYTKVGGVWKYAYVYTKVNGVWKEMT